MAQEVQIRATERGFAQVGASFSRLQKQAGSLKGSMLKLGAGLGLGFGAMSIVKDTIKIDAALTRLAIAAGKGPEAVAKLRAQALTASSATGKSIGELIAGANKIAASTGNYDLAIGSMETIGRVSQATGAEIDTVASAYTALARKMKIDPSGIERVFDILATQGQKGGFQLAAMSDGLSSLLAGLSGFNVQGEAAVRTLGAFLQVAKGGAGGQAGAMSGLSALMFSLRDPKAQKRMSALGIKNVGTANPIETIMKLIAKTGGDQTKLATILPMRKSAKAALIPLIQMFQKTGGFGELLELEGMAPIGKIAKDLKTWTNTAAGQLERAKNEMENVGIDKLSEAVRGLATHGDLLVKGINWAGNNLGTIAAGLVALKLGRGAIGIASGAGVAAAGGGGIGAMAVAATAAGKQLGPFKQSVANAGGALAAFSGGVQALGLGFAFGTFLDQWLGLSDKVSNWMYEALHPEEVKRRRMALLSETELQGGWRKTPGSGTTQGWGAVVADEQTRSMQRSAEDEAKKGELLSHAYQYVRGGRGKGGTTEATLTKEAMSAGYSKEEAAQLVPILLRIAKGVEVGIKVDVTGPAGLDKPPVVRRRGPSQARTGW
jgi:TP901 family phage tail tape measure protein